MDTVVYLSAAIADAIADCLPEEELVYAAALLTAVADQLALIAVCRDTGAQQVPPPTYNA